MPFFSRENSSFKTRSAERNLEADHARVSTILDAIDDALRSSKAEHDGLRSRIDDVIARAAVTVGNDSDEYLTRESEDNRLQSLLGTEIASGQRRLGELATTIGHFNFLKTELVARFPDLRPPTDLQRDLNALKPSN